ncbi:hypothetical protein BKA70DRAFT_232895 [Coprinopsis sp. MPI-PUGE-AT-0042]|nr:hypothetical protein BKA70DRAFT_232895 [Coprinopsis sp. MPI-PUGE-AT-0042]
MAVPDLPAELWLEITKYLDPAQKHRMMSLNRSLLNIALDELYRDRCLLSTEHLLEGRFLSQIKNSPQEVKQRLRHLYLRPHTFGPLLKTRWSLLPDARRAKRVFKTLAQVENLLSLCLLCAPGDEYEGGFAWTIPFITPILARVSPTLCDLVLRVPLEVFRDMDAPSLLFPALCDLTVQIFTSSGGSTQMESNYLAPFLNNQKSIQHLSISWPDDDAMVSLFSNLDHFPSLSEFLLNFCLDAPSLRGTSGVRQFIAKHTSQIQLLALCLRPSTHGRPTDGGLDDDTRTEAMVQKLPFNMDMPPLHSLNLSTSRQLRAKDIATCLSKYPKLVDFSLDDKLLNLRELGTIVSQFEGKPLKSLSIYIRFFGPDTIDLLSSKLPSLHRLKVSFDTFVGRGTPDYYGPSSALHSRPHSITTHVEDFLMTMKGAVWTWGLYRLDFQKMLLDIYRKPGQKGDCCRALVDALPSVALLNGMGRDEIRSQLPSANIR